MGTFAFIVSILIRGLDIEVLMGLYWLDKVVLLLHCCAIRISCFKGTTLHPVAHAADIIVNLQHSVGRGVHAKILGPQSVVLAKGEQDAPCAHRTHTVHLFYLYNLPNTIVLLCCCPVRCRVAELVPHFTLHAHVLGVYLDPEIDSHCRKTIAQLLQLRQKNFFTLHALRTALYMFLGL